MINVIIPTYKARDTLPKALDSLVAQTKPLFLVTIVQDCDGEDYSDIIEEYDRRGLHISLLQMGSNMGPGMARQAGLDMNTRCEYVMFLDSDDVFMPQAIEVLGREAKVNNADVIMSDILAEGHHQPTVYLAAVNTTVQWCHGKIYRADYLRQKDIKFLPEINLNEDSYFNLVACNATEKRVKVPQATYLWRYNTKSLTRGDKSLEFFSRSWYQYIISQVKGLEKLYSYGSLDDVLVSATVLNIYKTYMKAIHLKVDLAPADDILKEMQQLQPLWKQTENKVFWEYLNANLPASEIEDDEMWFYKYRFIDWIEGVKSLK